MVANMCFRQILIICICAIIVSDVFEGWRINWNLWRHRHLRGRGHRRCHVGVGLIDRGARGGVSGRGLPPAGHGAGRAGLVAAAQGGDRVRGAGRVAQGGVPYLSSGESLSRAAAEVRPLVGWAAVPLEPCPFAVEVGFALPLFGRNLDVTSRVPVPSTRSSPGSRPCISYNFASLCGWKPFDSSTGAKLFTSKLALNATRHNADRYRIHCVPIPICARVVSRESEFPKFMRGLVAQAVDLRGWMVVTPLRTLAVRATFSAASTPVVVAAVQLEVCAALRILSCPQRALLQGQIPKIQTVTVCRPASRLILNQGPRVNLPAWRPHKYRAVLLPRPIEPFEPLPRRRLLWTRRMGMR